MLWLIGLGVLAVVLVVCNSIYRSSNGPNYVVDEGNPRLQAWKEYRSLKDALEAKDRLDREERIQYTKVNRVRPVFQGRGRLFRDDDR
jgi:hypothetical protein